MNSKRKKRANASQRTRNSQSGNTREWVGGRLTSPMYVLEPAPYRPEVILWLELPDDLIVGCQLIDPAGLPVSFAESLRHVMRAPMIGPPRRPVRIRVPGQQQADEVRRVAPEAEIVVAPASAGTGRRAPADEPNHAGRQ